MNWTEWWIELTGRLVADPHLKPPAKYRWDSVVTWECWPPLPVAPNFVANADLESWSHDSFKLLLF